jgi:hypothetical protein
VKLRRATPADISRILGYDVHTPRPVYSIAKGAKQVKNENASPEVIKAEIKFIRSELNAIDKRLELLDKLLAQLAKESAK